MSKVQVFDNKGSAAGEYEVDGKWLEREKAIEDMQ